MLTKNFIIVCSIPFLVLIIVFLFLLANMRKDNACVLMGKQFQSGFDYQLYNMLIVGDEMAGNPAMMNFSTQNNILDNIANEDRYNILREISDNMTTITSISDSVQQCYIYVPADDEVLSSKGILQSEYFYRVAFGNVEPSYAEWKDSLDSVSGTRLLAFDSGDKTFGKNIYYALRLQYNADNPIILVLELDPGAVPEQMRSLRAQGMQFAVYRSDQSEIFGTSSVFTSISAKKLWGKSDADGPTKIKTSAGSMVISRLHSLQTDCTYVFATPSGVYYRQFNLMLEFGIAIFISLIFIDGYIAFLLASRSYRPISSLVESIRKNPTMPSERSGNSSDDLQYIKESFGQLSGEKIKLETRLYCQTNNMSHYVIARLMYGRYFSRSSIKSSMGYAGIRLPGQCFLVVLAWSEEYLNSDDKEIETLQFVVGNIFGELFSQHSICYTTPMDGKTGILLNLQKEPDEELFQVLRSCAAKGREFIHANFAVDVYVTISNCYQDVGGVHSAYRESESLMENASNTSPILCAAFQKDEKKNDAFSQFVSDPISKIHNLLLIGDCAGIKKCITEEIANAKTYGWKENIILTEICASLLRHLACMELGKSQAGEQLEQKITDILAESSCTVASVFRIVDLIGEYILQSDCSQKNKAIEKRLQDYVKDHFTDCELTVSSIAEALDVHVNYLSSIYKKKTGKSVLDCINFYRLSQAKLLFQKSKLSVEEIGLRCGYCNSAGFIRSFKKYEGITPGQYRSLRHD